MTDTTDLFELSYSGDPRVVGYDDDPNLYHVWEVPDDTSFRWSVRVDHATGVTTVRDPNGELVPDMFSDSLHQAVYDIIGESVWEHEGQFIAEAAESDGVITMQDTAELLDADPGAVLAMANLVAAGVFLPDPSIGRPDRYVLTDTGHDVYRQVEELLDLYGEDDPTLEDRAAARRILDDLRAQTATAA